MHRQLGFYKTTANTIEQATMTAKRKTLCNVRYDTIFLASMKYEIKYVQMKTQSVGTVSSCPSCIAREKLGDANSTGFM